MKMREMTIADYSEVMSLLQGASGVRLRDADSREATERYLARNAGLSFVAVEDGQLIGCVMCGHDGRRGYLQHLAVAPSHRRQGIGSALVAGCVSALEGHGILKLHIDVLVDNTAAAAFWARRGWKKRDDIHRFSFLNSNNPNA